MDPPFNSNASYNVLFREKSREESPAQIRAFTDTWEWTLETELIWPDRFSSTNAHEHSRTVGFVH